MSIYRQGKICTGWRGFTLVEVLVVMAIIALIVGATLMVGGVVQKNARIKNTKGTISLLVSALREYDTYKQDGNFPPGISFSGSPPGYSFNALLNSLPANDSYDLGLHEDFTWQDADAYTDGECDTMKHARATIECLYYYLDSLPVSRKFLSGLSEDSITNDDLDSVTINGQTKALLEVNDAWMHPIGYTNNGSGNFPTLTSAGPDGLFNTADDIISDEF